MKAPTPLVLIALFSLLVPLSTFAAAADVMVVVNGNTEVNREAYNYIRKTFQANNIKYTTTATLDPSSVKAGQYKTVVVLNTGTASGLDPVLQKFIGGFGDKKSLFLVNLFKGQSPVTVTTFTASSNSDGVDGVTAASTWMHPFGSNSGVQEMHLAWIKELVKFLGRP